MWGNWFCAPIIFKNPLKTGFSIRNILLQYAFNVYNIIIKVNDIQTLLLLYFYDYYQKTQSIIKTLRVLKWVNRKKTVFPQNKNETRRFERNYFLFKARFWYGS